MSATPPKPVVLLVEDDPTDILLMQEALNRIGKKVDLRVVHNGVEAADFVQRRGAFCNAPVPNLILLDLNTPKKPGSEVMAEIKSDPILRMIPVIVFTGSTSEQDIRSSYENYASCYVVKPRDFIKFRHALEAILELWLNVAILPATSPPTA